MKHRIQAKAPLTLIELAVALILTGILLALLWQGYRFQQHTTLKIEEAQSTVQKQLFCKQRIEKILFPFTQNQKESFLYSPSPSSLCLSYLQKVDPNPLFLGNVRSLLYLDNSCQLCLASWTQEQTARIEILLEQVKNLSFTFLDPKTALWLQNWPESFGYSPSWVRLQVGFMDNTTHNFLWKVGRSEDPILYVGENP